MKAQKEDFWYAANPVELIATGVQLRLAKPAGSLRFNLSGNGGSMTFTHHKGATDPRRTCPGATVMASRLDGVIRDYPVRLRLKYRVHAPE